MWMLTLQGQPKPCCFGGYQRHRCALLMLLQQKLQQRLRDYGWRTWVIDSGSRGTSPSWWLLVHGKELPISFADISVPGEHSLSGRRADAEIQLVHLPADPTQALAVALLMDDGGDASNVWLQHMAALPRAGEVAQVQGVGSDVDAPGFFTRCSWTLLSL